ncbi:unknown [Bacteroides sp. CAG:770]|nr:unknown [Bacteroides sp. CAG:770]
MIQLDSIPVGVAAAAGKSSPTTRRPAIASRMTIFRR